MKGYILLTDNKGFQYPISIDRLPLKVDLNVTVSEKEIKKKYKIKPTTKVVGLVMQGG